LSTITSNNTPSDFETVFFGSKRVIAAARTAAAMDERGAGQALKDQL
jgi:hypothetical protein